MQNPHPEEIAEMKRRGYDTSTIAEARRKSDGWPALMDLCRVIEEAFDGVRLGEGVGLLEAQGLDDFEDAAVCAAWRAGDEKEDWRRIPVEYLNRCHTSLGFSDAAGMRFHLPAYLIADLQGHYHFGMAFTLTHLSDHCIERFSLLSTAQRSAVRKYLLHIAEDTEYVFDFPHIVRALNDYWTEPFPA